MSRPPFSTAIETSARAADWRFIFRLDGWDLKISRDQAVELAKHMRDAIDKLRPRDGVIKNHEGDEIIVQRFGNKISLNFRSQHPNNPMRGTGEGISFTRAEQLLIELDQFAQETSRL